MSEFTQFVDLASERLGGWVVLAKVTTPLDERRQPLDPVTDYRVRRFIRPVMAADPYWAEASGADD